MKPEAVRNNITGREGFPHKVITFIVTLMIALPFWVFMKVFTRTTVVGRENLEKVEKPYLFVSNHVSMLDDAFIGSVVFFPQALFSYRHIPYHTPEKKNFYRGPVFSWVMDHTKCIPLTRGKGVYQPGIQTIIDKLNQGGVVHIYPEGTRTRSGDVGKGKPGVGRIVYASRCRVVPCYHSGLNQVLPIGKKIPLLGKTVKIIIGEPITFEEQMQKENNISAWQEISDIMIKSILNLKDRLESA